MLRGQTNFHSLSSFNGFLMSTYFVLHSVLGVGKTAAMQTDWLFRGLMTRLKGDEAGGVGSQQKWGSGRRGPPVQHYVSDSELGTVAPTCLIFLTFLAGRLGFTLFSIHPLRQKERDLPRSAGRCQGQDLNQQPGSEV